MVSNTSVESLVYYRLIPKGSDSYLLLGEWFIVRIEIQYEIAVPEEIKDTWSARELFITKRDESKSSRDKS